MKKSFFKKAVSLVSAAAMTLGMFAGVVKPASAAMGYWPTPLEISNEYYYEGTTLQPYGSCFQIDELKNWSPDNDPDARYNRGAIPLADRWMGPNVNPLASRDAKMMPLAMSNARCSQAPSQGGDGDFVYAFNNFQYVDVYNFWGGAAAEGPIAIPSPEIIDSAHRNGVPATGTIFLPWGDGTYGSRFVSEMVQKDADGHYPAADKLIEIAQYYGFDGYIFNAESGTGTAGFKDFLAYIQENKPDNFTISWYNGSGSLSTGSIQSWMQDGDRRITDEWWLDMGGSGMVDGTIEAAQSTGVDPWNIHSTWEYWPHSANAKGGRYQTRLGADKVLKCSLGILAPTCTLTQSVSSDDYINVQDQKMWVGPSYDPTAERPANGDFCGFANLIADRTPVIGTDFVTNFTTGNGYKFFENGEIIGKENGWYNRSLTDVLPTWRWIIESEGRELDAKIDFEDAWYAGTSMKLYGGMGANASNHVKLYSCQLEITEDSVFTFISKANKAGVDVELGLCFGDTYDIGNFKFYDLDTTANGEWDTTTLDLSEDAGKTAIAISLRLNAPEGVEDYALNVGQMAFTTHATNAAAVSHVTVDEVFYASDIEMQARVYWEKAEDAFMYRIYRIHEDGTREFVAATPSDAFYLGTFQRDSDEATCDFEIVSYSANYEEGGKQTFSIDWPEKLDDGYVYPAEQGENLAFKKPAACNTRNADDGPVHLINDGVIPSSKWCGLTRSGYAVIDLGENKTIQRWVVYHANCDGAGEGVDMNTVSFDLQYAADDGKPLLAGDDSASRSRVAGMSFTKVDSVSGNKQDVTDRNLAEPITARYIKLNITQSDNSPWSAIRIYEFELYENPGIDNTPSPNERMVTVVNNAGANDTVVVDNISMIYSSGTYNDHNGVFHEDTGKVRLFDSLDAAEPFAVFKAEQPNNSYKERSAGIATITGLELNPEGGRLYYDVLDGSGTEVTNSRRSSVYYAPETGTAPTAPETVKLARTTGGLQARKQYGRLTLTGLDEGATVRVYTAAEDTVAVVRSMAAVDGVASVAWVPMARDGGSVYYEIHVEGKPVSQRYEIAYTDPMELPADLEGLNDLIAKCEAIDEADCVSSTYAALSEKLAAAKTVAADAPNGRDAETARLALNTAYAALRFKGNSQRLGELCAKYEAAYKKESYTNSSFAAFETALNNAKNAIAADNSSKFDYEQLRIKLEAAVRGLEERSETVITGIEITPAADKVVKGKTLQFTAVVQGTGDVDQTVVWSVTGAYSADTTIDSQSGLLTVAKDEKATQLTVWAGTPDHTVFNSSTVAVVDEEVEPTDPTEPEDTEFRSIFHLDAGRKYFSVESIKSLLDSMDAACMNELQLYFSDNEGFRFGLDDMTITTEFGEYDLTPCLGDGYTDGNKDPDGSGKWLTESEMEEIIAYANSLDIAVVPCLDMPGHMGAILEEFPELRYTGSRSSIDLTNAEAVAFTLALLDKYAEWFADRGCTTFNFGADEYANDAGGMGFDSIYNNGKMADFVTFCNKAVDVIKAHGMTPRAFNDGFCYNNNATRYEKISTDVEICYWSSGWWGYYLASASYLQDQGYKLINTHGDWYWILGGGKPTEEKAAQFDYQTFPYRNGTPGSAHIEEPMGAMFCVWCDVASTDGPDGGTKVAADVDPILKAFGSTLPGYEEPVDPTEPTDPEPTDPEPTEPGGLDEENNVALDSTVIAYNGQGLGTAAGPEKLFDGAMSNPDTDKWCEEDALNKKNNWVAFDIGEARNLGKLVMYHAGSNGEWSPSEGAINTDSYQFYALNTDKISVEDLLAKSFTERTKLLADTTYWVEIANTIGNKQDITIDDLDVQDARIFKLSITKTDSTGWLSCVRLYELELYAYTSGGSTEEVSVTVTPTELTVDRTPGQKGQFTAVVEGTDNIEVEWTIEGNTSAGTMIGNGQLFLGADENADVMTVTATSVADPTKSATATVYVEDVPHTVSVSNDLVNGTVTPSVTEATRGTEITLTVEPDAGYKLVEGSLKVNGEPIEGTTFVMPDEDVVITAEFTKIVNEDLEALKAAAEAAAKAAQEAQAAAEAARDEALKALEAANEAAESAAENQEAAAKARAEAEAAQAKAEAAQAAAEKAQEAAETAQEAAENAQAEAAQEALKAAQEAAKAAEEAAAAAKSASDAAQAQAAAQAAQEAAEAAQAKAEAAQKGAEEAREKAEEYANSADVSAEEALEAAKAAQAAEAAAKEAQTAAENAQAAAEASKDAADASNKAAAEAAAEAAKYAKEVAETYAEIVRIKLELVDMLEEARLAAAEAKKAALIARKYNALIELIQVDTSDMNHVQKAAAEEIIVAARAAVEAAGTIEDVDAAMAAAEASLKDLDKLACAAEAFSDVSEDDWFHEDADFMLNNGYMNGYPGGTFRPDVKVSRAQLVTILYRVAGEPEVEGAADFSDVAEDYYTNAVIWAAEQGITTGYPDGTFRPNAEVSRQELVTFLYRFAEAEAVEEDHLTQFPDAGKVADYAVESMNWAIANGIVSGAVRDNVLVIAPEDTARRDETCAIVARYMNAN